VFCVDSGTCTSGSPQELNIPQFIKSQSAAKAIQHDSGKGAAIGAGAGALAGRHRRRMEEEQAEQQVQQQGQQAQQATQQQMTDFKKAFSVCLKAKNYMLEI
jgi:hypothetical protein